MSDLQKLSEAVVKGNRKDAVELTKALLAAGMKPLDIVEQALVPGMAQVGELFKSNQIFVPEMLIAARAMKEAMAVLEPLLVQAGIKPKFTA
ncbi:MAG: B12-binding domain-containing protein, partial [Verrucomicrobiae bacterium]|nr:B12-binding domain-containing protein [Verrucomicrobiae bacterium]